MHGEEVAETGEEAEIPPPGTGARGVSRRPRRSWMLKWKTTSVTAERANSSQRPRLPTALPMQVSGGSRSRIWI